MRMTDAEFERIYRFLKLKYGIDLKGKREIVIGRLDNYIQGAGYTSYSAYLDAMERDPSSRLEKALVDRLSTNHTFFMREFEHMEYLRRVVLPELAKSAGSRKDLGIWCGAASTGEEPYTLAMVIRDFFSLDFANWDTKILATDISTQALEHAVKGIYELDHMVELPPQWQRHYFTKLPDGIHAQVKPELRSELIFRKFNLMDPFLFRRKFHVIFLRNVMIYFDKPTKDVLIRKVYDSLEPGGYLFIGRTETIDRDIVPFKMVQPSVFKK